MAVCFNHQEILWSAVDWGLVRPPTLICEHEWVSRIAETVTNLAEYIGAATRIRSALAPHVTELLRLGVSVVFDFGGNSASDRNWVRSIFDRARAEHVLH